MEVGQVLSSQSERARLSSGCMAHRRSQIETMVPVFKASGSSDLRMVDYRVCSRCHSQQEFSGG